MTSFDIRTVVRCVKRKLSINKFFFLQTKVYIKVSIKIKTFVNNHSTRDNKSATVVNYTTVQKS